MLFIAVNLERFTLSCCFVGYCLFGQVYLYFCFRVRVDRVEQFFQKPSLTTTGKTKLFSSLFLWISAKKLETTTRKPYPAIAHAACSRLDPEPKFFRSQGFPPHKWGYSIRNLYLKNRQDYNANHGINYHQRISLRVWLPLKTGRDDLVCIHIFQRKRDTSTCYYIEFLFHIHSFF